MEYHLLLSKEGISVCLDTARGVPSAQEFRSATVCLSILHDVDDGAVFWQFRMMGIHIVAWSSVPVKDTHPRSGIHISFRSCSYMLTMSRFSTQ